MEIFLSLGYTVEKHFSFLLEPLTDELIQMTVENPAIAKRTVIYNLNWEHSNKPICLRLNKTDSKVSLEFEIFLEKNLGVRCKPIPEILDQHILE